MAIVCINWHTREPAEPPGGPGRVEGSAMPATIRDVARACGVHVSTVSRTFSAPNLVNPETRGRVLATAEHLR